MRYHVFLLSLLLLVSCRTKKEVVDARLDSVAVREVCVRDSLYTDFCLRFDSLQLYVLDDEGVRVRQVMCVKGGEMVRTKTETKTKTEADSTCVKTKTKTKTITGTGTGTGTIMGTGTCINTYVILIIAIIILIMINRVKSEK